jgi:hypothetical protein
MDLGTIKTILKKNNYWNAKECIQDFDTMFYYCHIYNDSTSDVVIMATKLGSIF